MMLCLFAEITSEVIHVFNSNQVCLGAHHYQHNTRISMRTWTSRVLSRKRLHSFRTAHFKSRRCCWWLAFIPRCLLFLVVWQSVFRSLLPFVVVVRCLRTARYPSIKIFTSSVLPFLPPLSIPNRTAPLSGHAKERLLGGVHDQLCRFQG